MIRPTHGWLLLTSLALAALGCSREVPPPAPVEASAPDAAGDTRAARTLPVPGEALPPGHPPVEGVSGGGPLRWDVPKGWIEETPRSNMRRAQYRVPGPAGDGECVVFYFGPGQGGDPLSNAERWAGQFQQPDGSSSIERMQVSKVEGAAYPSQLVEVTGTYDGGMTMTDEPSPSQPDSMLLGGIVEGPDAPWFFKFTGPEATLRARRGEFVELLRSVRGG